MPAELVTNESERVISAMSSKILKNHKEDGHKDLMEIVDSIVPSSIEVEESYDKKHEREQEYWNLYGDASDLEKVENVSYVSGQHDAPEGLTQNLGEKLAGLLPPDK